MWQSSKEIRMDGWKERIGKWAEERSNEDMRRYMTVHVHRDKEGNL